jgi:thiamine kinase-like enzyme
LLGPLAGDPVALDGGITNRNFRVTLGRDEYVVRCPGADTAVLGIDRNREHAATVAASRTGVGPEVAAFLPAFGCLVTRFVTGRPLTGEELRGPGLAEALRAVHAGPAIPGTFSGFRVVEAYRRAAAERGRHATDAYRAAADLAQRIEAALTGPEHDPVPCHNDLLAGNLMHDGERVRIVDWEYAGMGDRYFDLANLSVNNGFDETDDRRLLEHYFHAPCPPRRLAALRLQRLMSDFREAMWGVLQSAVSALDVDFEGYADEHFARLQAEAARADEWLELARGA